ncbi:MAG: protein translocase subunit SecF [Candidatus Infernicultor aquiphilus]|uniref:Protein-export membrane protein SecF n=1 Tax=Candidatus Infernicultor aquiphilus TaxID=1805029 RepID=A0A1J5G824_9BACT|nr:protein translocase subunit SecF [bacterium]OIP68468.1 MAG: protein-export membrane protein SecF [Candidatus Atribacteria bacterium CG2_30_33_13]PIX33680.1 MAG: protein translocase subunit SecF [Candidatus Atribacteria bacterium CG_4_8_14_3_um_filter_34_18]PIY33287.1 MAG: protein translocase subunit SecF [Candidatus Atribacteria bacterium CG_4_10_14_3_um_filter_34_13]PJB58035.1 MAG: protein translocase subunit SecF [Candidatus Atribacteria bacterium CG_4_9_14_3_um_filter_33_16]
MDLFKDKNFNFIKNRKIAYTISAVIILVGLISFIFHGFNFGIDFIGGTLLQLRFDKSVSTAEIRKVLGEFNLSQSTIQKLSENEFVIRTENIDSEKRKEILSVLKEKLANPEVLRMEAVGPVIGEDLKRLSLYALFFAFIGIILYVTLRFEFKFSIVSILALLHDCLIVLGIFSLLRKEITIQVVAAILTIIGYSVNNTIIILDRLRENIKFKTRDIFENLINLSINQTLTRTIFTTLTTIFPILTLYFFGGIILSDFALALLLGMVAGTYSSVFISSPLLIEWNKIFKVHQKGLKINEKKKVEK